jgi:ferredoxin-NADP reductase
MVRFEPDKKFNYEPGQFLSVYVPAGGKPLRRAYSLASPDKKSGYELCIRLSTVAPFGKGSSYLASLRPGDLFTATAPYGNFLYRPRAQRKLCMIATSTGIAPFRAMALSEAFKSSPPAKSLLIFGATHQSEILYPGEFESAGFETVACLSNPAPGWQGFHGRVTDYLRKLGSHWPFHGTDFYICGNGNMIAEVCSILREERGVSASAIIYENFSPATATILKAA